MDISSSEPRKKKRTLYPSVQKRGTLISGGMSQFSKEVSRLTTNSDILEIILRYATLYINLIPGFVSGVGSEF